MLVAISLAGFATAYASLKAGFEEMTAVQQNPQRCALPVVKACAAARRVAVRVHVCADRR
jgi:hypothetical protein